ncbi:MAG: ABC transporter ATP-binding protein [Gemmatimonadota bacterium]|nr:ABC transporter ATP-binding protein [Gemmatimonadota bacterium]
MSSNASLIRVESICRRYAGGVEALAGVSFTAGAGEIVAVTGPSGCGKSTLLALLGLLDQPTAGRVIVGGQDLAVIRHPAQFRARTVGFVFQFHHMVPTMTLLENVAAPMIAIGVPRRERQARALGLLEGMGLAARARFLPRHVSGGERQRAAVARALVNRPAIILADEPTGNLDTGNGEVVVELLVRQARDHGALVIMATHNPEVARVADWRLELRDGVVVGHDASPVPHPGTPGPPIRPRPAPLLIRP